MKMPNDIEKAMARLDRAAGAFLGVQQTGKERWGLPPHDELVRASLDLLNRIRREPEQDNA